MEPLVSVVTITYNHEPWIEKCIESVLAQEVNFPIEHIIAEDFSTDQTRIICENYAHKYPNIIRLLPSDHNLGYKENEKHAMQAVRGKYIAFLEGDDYWTDTHKLQKQIDFLESHPDYAVCFTRWKNITFETGEENGDKCDDLFQEEEMGIDIPIDLYFKRWCTQPLTMVYRADAISLELYDHYKYYRDMHQIFHLLKAGKGFVLNFISGCRVKHEGGMASMISTKKYVENSLPMDLEFWKKSKSPYAKCNYLQTLQDAVNIYSKEDKHKARKYAFQLFILNRKIKRFVTNWHNIQKAK